MRKVLAVIRREFVERVRTRAFVISTILGPVFMGVLIFLPVILANKESGAKPIVVVDAASGTFGDRAVAALQESQIGTGAGARPRYSVHRIAASGRAQLVADSLTALIGLSRGPADAPAGFVVLTDDALATGTVAYFGSNVGSLGDMESLRGTLRPVIQTERLVRDDVDTAVVRRATAPIALQTSKITEGRLTGESGTSSFILAYVMTLILYISLLLYGIQVMSSVLEEKTSRIMEVLSSSLSPFQLMVGKVVGVGSVGLFQLSIWAAAALYLTANLVPVLHLLHLPAESAADISVPNIPPALLVIFLTFFLLGFMLYASLYAAVGAMCSTQQDTQQAQQPVMLGIVAGFMCMFPVLNDPSGSLARTLSLIPFVAPFVTPLRYSIAPLPPEQLLMSMASTLLGVFAIIWLASRIYRVGILAYGKRPTFRELWGWIRTA
jgi:ABC-2 type transport system permease protein